MSHDDEPTRPIPPQSPPPDVEPAAGQPVGPPPASGPAPGQPHRPPEQMPPPPGPGGPDGPPPGPPGPPAPMGPPPPMPPQPPMGPPPGAAPEPTEPRKRRRWPWVVGVVAAFVIGTTLGAASSNPDPEIVTETETITETETEEVEVPPADLEEQRQAADERDSELDTREEDLDTRASDLDARKKELDTREEEISTQEMEIEENTIPGTGVYIVGEDIAAGTYSTQVTSLNCYWARLSGTGGDLDDIITNNNVSEGQALVTIAESDVAFETNGCGEWTRR